MIVSKRDKCGAEKADATSMEEYGFWTTTTIIMRCKRCTEARGAMKPSGETYAERIVCLPDGTRGGS
jgi:hypothetical protein